MNITLRLAACVLANAPLAALVVDTSEAPNGCSLPSGVGDHHILCWYTYTCTRADGAPTITAGTKQLLNSIDYICDNCGNKTTPKICKITGTITQTSNLTTSIEAAIKAGAAGIESSLKSVLTAGLTFTNTVTGETTVTALAKEKKITQFSIYFESDRKASITSAYTCIATESSWSPAACVPYAVSYSGGSRVSTGTASGFAGSITDKTFDGPCPE